MCGVYVCIHTCVCVWMYVCVGVCVGGCMCVGVCVDGSKILSELLTYLSSSVTAR